MSEHRYDDADEQRLSRVLSNAYPPSPGPAVEQIRRRARAIRRRRRTVQTVIAAGVATVVAAGVVVSTRVTSDDQIRVPAGPVPVTTPTTVNPPPTPPTSSPADTGCMSGLVSPQRDVDVWFWSACQKVGDRYTELVLERRDPKDGTVVAQYRPDPTLFGSDAGIDRGSFAGPVIASWPPASVAVDGDVAWLANGHNACGATDLVGLGLADGHVTGEVTLPSRLSTLDVVGGSAFGIREEQPCSSRPSGALVQIDLASGRSTPIDLPGPASLIVAGTGAAYVAVNATDGTDRGVVYRVDPSGSAVRLLDPGLAIGDIQPAGDAIWVVGTGSPLEVLRIDGRTGAILTRVTLSEETPSLPGGFTFEPNWSVRIAGPRGAMLGGTVSPRDPSLRTAATPGWVWIDNAGNVTVTPVALEVANSAIMIDGNDLISVAGPQWAFGQGSPTIVRTPLPGA